MSQVEEEWGHTNLRAGRGGVLRRRHGIDVWIFAVQRKQSAARGMAQEESDRGEWRSMYDHGEERGRYCDQRRWPQVACSSTSTTTRRRKTRQDDHACLRGVAKCGA